MVRCKDNFERLKAAPRNIILTRNDGVGDMVLMLPMCALIKAHFPQTKIAILGKAYTRDLVEACIHVDQFIDEQEFYENDILINGVKPECIIHVRTNKRNAKRARTLKIPLRIGTSSRVYHWLTCNKLVKLKRKRSELHEAQLNLRLLSPLGIAADASTEELGTHYGLQKIPSPDHIVSNLLDPARVNFIIHPKSQGSSKEWPLEHMSSLINLLDDRFNIILTGVVKEQPFIDEIKSLVTREVKDACGKLSLKQFMSLIKASHGLLANATGPAHLAAALGTHCFALYPPTRPIHPGRWRPLGKHVTVLVADEPCEACKKGKDDCSCMASISPAFVAEAIKNAFAISDHH